jgi:hypothetical protein
VGLHDVPEQDACRGQWLEPAKMLYKGADGCWRLVAEDARQEDCKP